jgi:glycosyltransferase involved in cell wall biosynthesis
MRLVVTAPRGSGGAYAHLPRVLPRIMALRPQWDVELVASADVLEPTFGTTREPWMRPLGGGDYRTRLRWEFVELPELLRRDPRALVYSPFGPPLNLANGPRVVWASRNIIPLLPVGEWEISEGDRARMLALRLLLVAWARAGLRCICVSQHARERLSALAAVSRERIAVVPHGTDPPAARPCSDAMLETVRASRYVLHVGQPVAYKRTLELAQAWAQLAARRADLPPLVVAGRARPQDAEYERRCLEPLRPLMVDGRVRVLGHVPHVDTLALMASAHAFVYPSVHEDCPNVVLEALAAGRASVFADIPAVRELAADAAVYVRDPRPASLAAALERAIFDPGLRAGLEAGARERAALFTWDRTARRIAEVLDEALSSAPHA